MNIEGVIFMFTFVIEIRQCKNSKQGLQLRNETDPSCIQSEFQLRRDDLLVNCILLAFQMPNLFGITKLGYG